MVGQAALLRRTQRRLHKRVIRGRLTPASRTTPIPCKARRRIPAPRTRRSFYQTQPTYDALGNVIETTTTLLAGVDTQVFCYDDLSRRTWAGSSGTLACSGAPTPGDTGSLAGTSAIYAASYSYDDLNRLTSAPLGAYTYGDSAHADAATSIGTTMTTSSIGRLEEVTASGGTTTTTAYYGSIAESVSAAC